MLTKKGVRGCWVLSVAVFLTLSGLDPSFAAEKKVVTWGTTSSTSGAFTTFVAAGKILNDKIPEINITIRSTGASVHNARLMEQREVDMGAIGTGVVWDAMPGTGPFKGKPNPDLRLLYVITTDPLQFVVSEKSGIKDVYGLEGKMYTPGMLGSGTEQTAMDIFKILGLQPKLRHMSYADAIKAMKDERIVGFVKLGVPDASILDVASAMKIRILSFSDSDLDKIIKNTHGYRKYVVPQGMYPGVGEFKTLENEWGNYVGKDFPPELAYKVVRTIWEYRSEIKKANTMFVGDRLVDVALGVKIGYLHPGAIKFYRELGFTVPKNLVPPEMGEK